MRGDAIFMRNFCAMLQSSGKMNVEIAEMLGLKKSSISDYLYGRSTPPLDTIRKMCKIFDCRYEDLLGELD